MQKLSSFGRGKKFRPKKSLTSLLHAALQLKETLPIGTGIWEHEMLHSISQARDSSVRFIADPNGQRTNKQNKTRDPYAMVVLIFNCFDLRPWADVSTAGFMKLWKSAVKQRPTRKHNRQLAKIKETANPFGRFTHRIKRTKEIPNPFCSCQHFLGYLFCTS